MWTNFPLDLGWIDLYNIKTVHAVHLDMSCAYAVRLFKTPSVLYDFINAQNKIADVSIFWAMNPNQEIVYLDAYFTQMIFHSFLSAVPWVNYRWQERWFFNRVISLF